LNINTDVKIDLEMNYSGFAPYQVSPPLRFAPHIIVFASSVSKKIETI